MTEAEAKAKTKFFETMRPSFVAKEKRRKQERLIKSEPSGRIYRFPHGFKYTMALNIPIQGSAAEVILHAMIRLVDKINTLSADIRLVNIVHDEIVLETAEADAETAKSILEEAMIAGMLDVFPKACTKGLVEAHTGENWAKAK